MAVLPDHLQEGLLIGSFFLVCAVLQLAAAAWVSAGAGRRARHIIVAGNLLVIAIWAVSRTVGLPIGPDAGVPEAVSTLDALSFVAEIIAVSGLVLLARKQRAPSRVWRVGPVAALTLSSFLVAGTAMAFTPAEHHHDEPGAPAMVHVHDHPAGPAAADHAAADHAAADHHTH
jgi:hypothetical protein